MGTRISRRPAVIALVGWIACWGCGAKGKETSLAALQGKTLDLTVVRHDAASGSSTRVGLVALGLRFSDVGKWLGDACPIVRASATFGGWALKPADQGGAAQCSFNDDPACGQQCMGALWYADNITALLETLPQTADVVLKDGSETAVATVRNPAPMATVTVLDLVEGQEVHHGDSFHVQVQAQPPATIEDIRGGFYVNLSVPGGAGVTLATSPDPASGVDVWRVDVVPQTLPAGPKTFRFAYKTPSLHFDTCPSDFACSGISDVDLGEFALQYVP